MSKFTRVAVIAVLSIVEAGFCLALADSYLASDARAYSLELSKS